MYIIENCCLPLFVEFFFLKVTLKLHRNDFVLWTLIFKGQKYYCHINFHLSVFILRFVDNIFVENVKFMENLLGCTIYINYDCVNRAEKI